MQATNEPPSEYIIFEYSAEDAARTSICTVTHIQVVSAQLEFLKQQIRDFQVKYARPVHEPARLSIDQKPAEFKIQGRVATDFEAALASLFDHENKISLLAAMHTFVVLMNKCRSADERTLCTLVIQNHCTQKCLEEFVLVGGLRIVRLWTLEYERKNDLRALSKLADMCCSIPLNLRTKSGITDSGIPKCIKRLKKTEYNESALKCMDIWSGANVRLQKEAATAGAAEVIAPEVNTAAEFQSTVFTEVICAMYEEFVDCALLKYPDPSRQAERDRIQREKTEERERQKAKHALARAQPAPAKISLPPRPDSQATSSDAVRKPIIISAAAETNRKVLDLLSTRKVQSARRGLSLNARATQLLKTDVLKGILRKSATGEDVQSPSAEKPSEKKRPVKIGWVDEIHGKDLHSELEFELEEGRKFRTSCAIDKVGRSCNGRLRRERDDNLVRYQKSFHKPNIMGTFNLKKNVYRWSLNPSELQRLADTKNVDIETCKEMYVYSVEKEIQNNRMSSVPEANYGSSNTIPQDPSTFLDLNGQPVYTSHTYAKSRVVYLINDSSNGDDETVVETAITPADVAAGANDKMTYNLSEKKTQPVLMTYQIIDSDEFAADDCSPQNEMGAASPGFGVSSDETSNYVDVDVDGLSATRGDLSNLTNNDKNPDDDVVVSELGTDMLITLGNEVLRYFISNEDKLSELFNNSVVEKHKAEVLKESVTEVRESTQCWDRELDDIELELAFTMTMNKLSGSIPPAITASIQPAAPTSIGTQEMFSSSESYSATDLTGKIARMIAANSGAPLCKIPGLFVTAYGEKLIYDGKLKLFLQEKLKDFPEFIFKGTDVVFDISKRNNPPKKKRESRFGAAREPDHRIDSSRDRNMEDVRNTTPDVYGKKRKFQSPSDKICRFFGTSEGCRYGVNCLHIHSERSVKKKR